MRVRRWVGWEVDVIEGRGTVGEGGLVLVVGKVTLLTLEMEPSDSAGEPERDAGIHLSI